MTPARFLQHCGLPWQQPGLECTCSDVRGASLSVQRFNIDAISKFADLNNCHKHKMYRMRCNADVLAHKTRSHAEDSLNSAARGLGQKQIAGCLGTH